MSSGCLTNLALPLKFHEDRISIPSFNLLALAKSLETTSAAMDRCACKAAKEVPLHLEVELVVLPL